VKNETPTADSRIKGVQSIERRYDLSSLPLDVGQFAGAVRDHWGVENSCHWVLDVVMREDQSRARIGFPAENLATVRRMAINLLNREKTKKRGIKGKQLNASWDHNYLLRLLNF
jgi:predicted transposase YbfD/YdcC